MTKTKHVLIVDDEQKTLDILRNHAESLGMTVTTAISGLEAMEWLLADQQFDAVITDTRMPGMNGLMVLQAIYTLDDSSRPQTLIHSSDQDFNYDGTTVNLGEHVAEYFSEFAKFYLKGLDYTPAKMFMDEIAESK